ncbi:Esterase, SGNH hydrolase-type [Penicillium griseofulvum]|uniref:Esterase, SGNH hydrolase-type n=1 Tax=Penicillium patulum TaxID=5078 RepID=A0A135LPN7_PENPA|nr:Esterase, SGNH hydrolase-type [Penicillium griseofulvum]KXG50912.1 Esterase, SGNH hydrolase-type [Penicillium griseofulvum]
MTRLFNRFYGLSAVAVCMIFISAWFLTSRSLSDIVPSVSEPFQVASTFDQRLVVFGDSGSDNQSGEPQGKIWTDWLCSMFSCYQENLAQTANPLLKGRNIGAVVDNKELDLLGRLSQTYIPDFKSQLQQWLDAELAVTKGLSEEAVRSRQDRTIFVVSFGVWDIWSLITKDYDAASKSVERRIATLMDQLDVLSEQWGTTELKLILTQTVDVTFLPGFKSAGYQYKDTVRILEEWNRKLGEVVREWSHGTVYLFDTNAFIMDRIRDWQLYAAGIEEENELGKNLDGWENVEEPCVESGFGVMMSKEKKQCEHPDKYLFWNEMHLGPFAQRLMATDIYHGIEIWNPKGVSPKRHNRRGFAA